MNAKGVDVSHYQATTPPLAGLSFLIAKAYQAGFGKDPRYGMHIANARQAGLVTGAYCYNAAGYPIAAQVGAFIAAAGDVDLYALDVEGGADRFTVAQAADFMARFRAATGKRIGLYVSESPYVSGGYAKAKADWLWIAHYGVAQPAVRWDFHQYRGSPLDLDQYNGTDAELRAWVHHGGDMFVPQHLGHVVTTADARVYPEPDGTAIASRVPKGQTLRFFGAVAGWRYCELTLGGSQMYGWLRADETDDIALPLTITDGAPCKEQDARISAAIKALEG